MTAPSMRRRICQEATATPADRLNSRRRISRYRCQPSPRVVRPLRHNFRHERRDQKRQLSRTCAHVENAIPSRPAQLFGEKRYQFSANAISILRITPAGAGIGARSFSAQVRRRLVRSLVRLVFQATHCEERVGRSPRASGLGRAFLQRINPYWVK